MINTVIRGRSYSVAARFITRGAPFWGDDCLLWEAAVKSRCTARRGKAVQPTPGNYLGTVRGVQPERAEAGGLSDRSLVSERRPVRHHPRPSPLPSAAPVTCSSAIDISSLWDCSWVHSEVTLHFLPSMQRTFSFSVLQYSTHSILNLYKRKRDHKALISCELRLALCLGARAITYLYLCLLFIHQP